MPATPILTLTVENSSGRIKAEIANSDTPTHNELWVSTPSENNGDPMRVGDNIAVDGTFYHYGGAHGKSYSFFARAVNGTSADSVTQVAAPALTSFWLHAVDKASATSNLSGSALDLFNLAEARNQSRALEDYLLSGRSVLLAETSAISNHAFSATIRIPFTNDADRATLLDILESQRYVCARSQDGFKLFGVLQAVQFAYNATYTDFDLNLTEVDFSEHIA